MFYTLFETALGTCAVVFKTEESAEVIHILLPQSKKEIKSQISIQFPGSEESSHPEINTLISEIVKYLNGDEVLFTKDIIDTSVFYPFQQRVMQTDWNIPRGMTATYGWVAKQIGTNGVRAVGNANARNPIPLVYPCHRVIRSDRTLGGFGGGLEMKRQLLEMEGVEFDSSGRVCPEYILS
ncbi:MAG: methylated-DNA--[protein]-cysteine S-methyltransferase [Candidatus Thorarchaeota archaeon]